tara:strand:- start:29 stop:1756 length:1728 start_codon:yes stop_codon:yes gene_type:complete
MTRLEKIVLEQTRKSKPGTIGQTVSTDAVNQKAKQLKAMSFLLYYVFGKKESPIDKRKVASVLPRISIYGDDSIYSRGEYFYVIGEDYKENEGTNKAVMYFPIYIIRKIESDIEILNKFRIGGTDKAPVIDINDFQNIQDTIKKKKAEVEAAAAADAEKNKPAIEKTKVVVQNVIKGTETIDPNNLGKGTPDAKAFQELLYQVGLKLIPGYTSFKKFAFFRTSAPDGGWDGDIGTATLNMLDKLSLKDQYNSGDIAGVIKYLRGEFGTNESTNYFKGTGMNIKLKDLLQEQIKIKADDNVAGGGGGGQRRSGGGSTNFTLATLPAGYTGTGKITYDNDDTFEGSWKDRAPSGQGTYTWLSGTKYVGEWKNGKRDGAGTMTWVNRDKEIATWKAGKRSGSATFTFSNGDVRVGKYVNNKMEGSVKFTPKGGESVEETWKDGARLGYSNAYYWNIVVAWVKAEYDFWEGSGTGPEGQARPRGHYAMFNQYNSTWQDNEEGAKKAYIANRKIALQWLYKQLAGCVEVTGEDYYTKIKKWIYQIAVEIGDVFQNDRTITLVNPKEGDTITRTVQGEIDT